jgi:chromosome segregation ATPase
MPAKEAEQGVMEGTGGEFVSLEEKVYRTIELLKNAREGKAAAERDAARLREQLETVEEELETAKSQLISLKKEREEVRGRVEKMLDQIETIVAESGD